jgi:hypothetical protein
MATPPISPPFWMYNPPNPNMLVIDVAGYNAALGMGYVLTVNPPVIVGVPQADPGAGSMTNTQVNPTSGGPTIVDTSINPQQPDPYQPVPQG